MMAWFICCSISVVLQLLQRHNRGNDYNYNYDYF